jgi:hypothetical protein
VVPVLPATGADVPSLLTTGGYGVGEQDPNLDGAWLGLDGLDGLAGGLDEAAGGLLDTGGLAPDALAKWLAEGGWVAALVGLPLWFWLLVWKRDDDEEKAVWVLPQ